MPDVQEVFRMATQKVRPDPEALERQRRKQRGKLVRERVAVYALAAGLVAAGVIVGVSTLRSSDEPAAPASQGTETATSVEPSVSGEPSPDMQPPFTERFDSPLHGLSIGYPSGWRTRAATEPWSGGEVAFGAPDVDVIFDPTLRDDLFFAVVSEPKSGPDWVDARNLPPSLDICLRDAGGAGSGYVGTDYKLRGSGWGWAISCGRHVGGGHFVQVATATRGYIIYLHVEDERRLQATYDRDWFEAALETVDLPPEMRSTR